jgi:arabinofuranan 3-O-arabinosyltransferase
MSADARTNGGGLGLRRMRRVQRWIHRVPDKPVHGASAVWLRLKARATLLAYGVPMLVAAVAVQFWFRRGGELAGGDLVPPLVPGVDYRAHWNDFNDGAGSPGYAIVSFPYFEGLRAFHWLGLSAVLFQRLWLTMLLASAAAAVVFLARSLFRSPLAAAVAGVLSIFNGYRLVMGFDAVSLAAVVAAGFLGGLVIRSGRGRSAHPVLFAVASLTLGFVFSNPPHVVLVLAWVLVCVLLAWVVDGREALRRIRRFVTAAVPISLLFNLWWIVPAYLTLTGSVFKHRFAAPSVEQWAWTHQRASIANVLSLTSSWAWLRPEYYPFSVELERVPFSVLQYVPAGAAFLGVLLARGRSRRAAYVIAAVGLAAVWVAKGLHPPFGAVNLWLYDHVPGFWLFRDPAKLGFVLVLVFSLLIALAIVQLSRLSVLAGATGATLIVAAVVAYAHPLLTGEMIADKRPLLPPQHVRLPSAWRQAAAYLDAQPELGKVVILPQLDYYQAPTTWGYYGASFLHELIHRPVVEPLPGGYYSEPVVSQLVGELQREVVDGAKDVSPVLRALGARYVLLRHDLDTRFPGRSFVAPRRLARALARARGVRRVRSFGLVDLYEATGLRGSEVYPAVPLLAVGTSAERRFRPLALGANVARVVLTAKSLLRGIATGETRLLPAREGPARVRIFFAKRGTVISPERRTGGSEIVLPRLVPPFRIAIGLQSFIVSDQQPEPRVFDVTSASAPTVYRFLPSDQITLIPIRRVLAHRLGDCNRYDSRTRSETGLSASVVDRYGPPTLRLTARDHAACVAVRISRFRPATPLRVQLAYRGVMGNPPRICLWQEGPQRCADLPGLLAAPGWHRFDGTARPEAGTKSLWLFLYADGGGSKPTVTEYRELRVERPQPAIAVGIAPVRHLPEVSYGRVAPYEFRVHVRGAGGPFLLVLSETFAPGWRVEVPGHSSGGASHLRVNGYANGWRLPWRGTYDLKITYRPEQLALWAARSDLVLIPLALVLSLGRWGVRRRWQLVPERAPGVPKGRSYPGAGGDS